MKKNNYKVAVACTVYNHESYIAEAIESFLSQITNFQFIIVIGEDFSTDKSRHIILKYNEQFSDKFKLILHNKNVGAAQNFSDVLAKCNELKCDYIAYCDGDDYWTDPYKLQKQIDFLEANADFGLITGAGMNYNEETKQFSGKVGSADVEKYELIIRGFNDIIAPTALYRKSLLDKCIEDCQPLIEKGFFIDTAMAYWFAANSKIKYLDEVLCVYRTLAESASHTKNFNRRLQLDLKYFYLKLFFLIKYPIKNTVENQSVIDAIYRDQMEIVNFAMFLGDSKTRKSLSFKFGNMIINPIKRILHKEVK